MLKALSLLVIILVVMFGAYKGARYVAAHQKKTVISEMYTKAKINDSLKSGENLTYHLTKLGQESLQPDLYFDKTKKIILIQWLTPRKKVVCFINTVQGN